MTEIELYKASNVLEQHFGGRTYDYPFIKIPKGYEIAVIFPFACATARMLFKRVGDKPDQAISIYYDTKEHLGYYGGKPYWEALLDDAVRFDSNDTDGLIKACIKYLKRRREQTNG